MSERDLISALRGRLGVGEELSSQEEHLTRAGPFPGWARRDSSADWLRGAPIPTGQRVDQSARTCASPEADADQGRSELGGSIIGSSRTRTPACGPNAGPRLPQPGTHERHPQGRPTRRPSPGPSAQFRYTAVMARAARDVRTHCRLTPRLAFGTCPQCHSRWHSPGRAPWQSSRISSFGMVQKNREIDTVLPCYLQTFPCYRENSSLFFQGPQKPELVRKPL